jgi:exodeoxyribonuclease V alpha subunit
MRGGVQVWRRGVDGHGIRHAAAYALQGGCDAAEVGRQVSAGADAASAYGPEGAPTVVRHVGAAGAITSDRLDAEELRAWIDGADPQTGEQRGRSITSPDAHLLYDATINAPKSYSLAAVLHPELRQEYDALMDRVTAETVTAWSHELCTRRGAGGKQRTALARVEVVELDHERSRSLDPHAHRHLWLNAKVQGADGRWSNVDSQQVFRHQVLVNARGELAARTDARWRSALAAHGFTLDSNGEIAQLAHLVQPMSKRAAQITRNKDQFESEWRAQHPGQEPSPHLIESWDRRAWALDRAQKPGDLDETEWRDQVCRELAAVDPAVLTPRAPAPVAPVTIADVDRDHLTAHALGWTDQRSVRSQGRFSRIDLRAGATMAVAQAQLTEDPQDLARLVEEIETRALRACESLAPNGVAGPDDVKTLRLGAVGQTRARITERAALRAAIGEGAPASLESIAQAASRVDAERAAAGESAVQLDDRQIAAAAAIAGSASLVVVEGPAGAGKTTMLTVAERAVSQEGHRLLTVAPTMKAAQVAQAEVGADGSSLHALLYQYGYRWHTEESGSTTWSRLREGDRDDDGSTYFGPAARAQLQPGDLIVCDEAGMVDTDAMHALLTVADETAARLTLIGDPHQVRPVGHSGAMALVQAQTPDGGRVDLEAVHRFRQADDPRQTDTAYASISHDLRSASTPQKAAEVALWLQQHEHVDQLADTSEQVENAASAWLQAHGDGESIAIMASDNETVAAINDQIQAQRLDRGQINDDHAAAARSGSVHVGDVVTARKNHRGEDFSVSNRESFTIRSITEDGSLTVTGGIDGRTEQLPADYVAAHLELGYASTIHGAQGVTARRAVTVVSEQTTAAQLYVGMTRGKLDNRALVAASSRTQALQQLSDAMLRERTDLTDDELRTLVAADLDRAGTQATGPEESAGPASWRDAARPYGAVVDPHALYDRFIRERDQLTVSARNDEDRVHGLTQRLATDLDPAVAVARRDGEGSPAVAAAQKRASTVRRQLTEVQERLSTKREQVKRTDHRLDGLREEIELRSTLTEDVARTERDEREYAAIHQPARPTDQLHRPFGLTPSLARERSRVHSERDAARKTIDNASRQQPGAGARSAEARAEADEAASLATQARQRLEDATNAALHDCTDTLRTDLASLTAAREASHGAGLLRRRAAQRSLSEVEQRFQNAHGRLPDGTDLDSWIEARASEAAHDHVQAAGLPAAAEAAMAHARDTRSRADQAQNAEDALARSIHSARLDLSDLDFQETEIHREQQRRDAMPEDQANKERRLRGARNRPTQPTESRPALDNTDAKPQPRPRR